MVQCKCPTVYQSIKFRPFSSENNSLVVCAIRQLKLLCRIILLNIWITDFAYTDLKIIEVTLTLVSNALNKHIHFNSVFSLHTVPKNIYLSLCIDNSII